MPEDVKVPGLGEIPKKYMLWGGIGAAGIIAVYLLRSRASATAAAGTGTGTADTTGTGTAATDTTGTSPADGSGYYYPDTSSGYGGGGTYYGGNNPGYDAAGYPVGSQADLQWEAQQAGYATGTATGITTNDQWIAEAMSGLPGSPGTIQAALAGVLGGLTVTTAQKNIFLEAKGIYGDPPGGYPQPVKVSDTAAHPSGPSSKVKIPVITGETIPDAQRELAAVGLKSRVTGHVPRGEHPVAAHQSPRAGTVVARNSVVTITQTGRK